MADVVDAEIITATPHDGGEEPKGRLIEVNSSSSSATNKHTSKRVDISDEERARLSQKIKTLPVPPLPPGSAELDAAPAKPPKPIGGVFADALEVGSHNSLKSTTSRDSARASLSRLQAAQFSGQTHVPTTVAVQIDDDTTASVNERGMHDIADGEDVTYFKDEATGKLMMTKTMEYNGRPATVTVQVDENGRVVSVVGGTARRPEEPKAQYFRAMSSFALWQLQDVPSNLFCTWSGEQKYPYFCYGVIVVTAIMLIVEISLNEGVEDFAVNPMFGPKASILLLLGAKRTDLIQQGDFYRLFMPIVLHGGIIHWLFNMVGLYNIGFSLEQEFGTPKIALIFCVSGLVGVWCSAVFVPNVMGVGASGAIFGLFGAAWADLIQNWSLYKSRGNATWILLQLLFGTIVNTLIGLAPFLDQFAHLGGMITGFFLGLTLLLQRRYTRFGEMKDFKKRHRFLQLFGAIATPVAMVAFLVLMYTEDSPNGWCSWCKYIDCVPISGLWSCNSCLDGGTSGSVFTNNTMLVNCPRGSTYTSVWGNLTDFRTASQADVDRICTDQCGPP